MKRNVIFISLAISAFTCFYACNPSEKKAEETQTETTSKEGIEGAVIYAVDPAQSELKWKGTKVTGEHFGTIKVQEGTLAVKDEALVGGEVKIDMNTIVVLDIEDSTYNANLTGHLKNEDFFNVENHAVSTLEITDIKAGEGTSQVVTAKLTIKGITNEVSFPADITISEDKVSAKGTAVIDRTLWEIKYGSGKFFEGLGDKMIHDQFQLEFNIEAVK